MWVLLCCTGRAVALLASAATPLSFIDPCIHRGQQDYFNDESAESAGDVRRVFLFV